MNPAFGNEGERAAFESRLFGQAGIFRREHLEQGVIERTSPRYTGSASQFLPQNIGQRPFILKVIIVWNRPRPKVQVNVGLFGVIDLIL